MGQNVIVGVYGKFQSLTSYPPAWVYNDQFLTSAEKAMIGSGLPGFAGVLTVKSGGVFESKNMFTDSLHYLCHSDCPRGKG